MFRVIWPERTVVTPEKILSWYRDAVDNRELPDAGAVSAHQAAQALHEAGLITLRAR